jgi:broad specificity phosphatase PhoE
MPVQRIIIMEMTTLYLIRHCESRVLAGLEPDHPRNDSALSDHGYQQAKQLADHLQPYPITLILTSLALRAQQTAAQLNQIRQVPLFSAMALNGYFLRDDGRGVETAEQALVRSRGFIESFSPYYQHIAVVSHDTLLETIRQSYLNLPFPETTNAFEQPGTCRILRYDVQQGDDHWHEVTRLAP